METIDNIIAEMRGLALVDEESDEMVARKHMSLALSTYASRIEEAAKALVADRDNWRLQALAEGARANAATCKVFENACAARSDPPRNCDRFVDELDAQIEFLNDVWLISVTRDTMLERDKFENWTEEMKSAYIKWLFAKTKGE